MKRLTKRVGAGEATPVCNFDICAPFIKSGHCKTGMYGGFPRHWERHCNDACILGRMIDRLAANEVLQMGKGRAKDFCLAYMKAANEMSQLMHDDQRDDPDFEYAKTKIDQRIRAIIGDEIFVPWEVRYGQVEYKEE